MDVSDHPRARTALSPRGRASVIRYQLDRRLGSYQSRSGHSDGKKKIPPPFPGIEPRLSSPQPIMIFTELSRLMCYVCSSIELHVILINFGCALVRLDVVWGPRSVLLHNHSFAHTAILGSAAVPVLILYFIV